jgi:predicted 3-demethylubiquinone-9 3-methyltransferase (glyoxalase superfamily)
MTTPAKNRICPWYNGDAEDAARFYARTFPDSSVISVHRAPSDFPSGKSGVVLIVDFTVLGMWRFQRQSHVFGTSGKKSPHTTSEASPLAAPSEALNY